VLSHMGWNVVGAGVLFMPHPNMVLKDPNLSSSIVIALFTYVLGDMINVSPYDPFCCPTSPPKLLCASPLSFKKYPYDSFICCNLITFFVGHWIQISLTYISHLNIQIVQCGSEEANANTIS